MSVVLRPQRRRCLSAVAAALQLVAGVAFAQPSEEQLRAAVERAFRTASAIDDGANAQYIPALADADPDRFGLVAVTVDGQVVEHGDTDVPFAIMSAAKPFTLALVLQQHGADLVAAKIGVEPTGRPFNSIDGITSGPGAIMNPMVNAGAITAVSLVEADSPDERWRTILDWYGRFAGTPLPVMRDVYASVSATNHRNRALVNLLAGSGWLGAEPASTLDIYNKQSSLAVTARQLAMMGATLANGGVHPRNSEQILAAEYVDEVLAVMLLSGFYDQSGAWAYKTGLPGKSGVGGGIVVVAPGKLALASYSPRLSPQGNSVRGMKAIELVAEELGLGVFRSDPNRSARHQ